MATPEIPQNVDMEKEMLSSLLIRNGEAIPKVSAILKVDDFYRPEHRVIYETLLKLHAEHKPVDTRELAETLRHAGKLSGPPSMTNGGKGGIDLMTILNLREWAHTNAYSVHYATELKEYANRRRASQYLEVLAQKLNDHTNPLEDIASDTIKHFQHICNARNDSRVSDFAPYFGENFQDDISENKKYADRLTGFENLDEEQNFVFTPGVYIVGGTPAAGKTTFVWQWLNQLAENGEPCIFCSYEMSRAQMFAKSVARELFMNDPYTRITSAAIRRGEYPDTVGNISAKFAQKKLPLKVIELQNETIDELLNLLRPMCINQEKAPVVCIDYLQIIPTEKDNAKTGVDDIMRKLKVFQRDTNTTFIVVSSFNRTNYIAQVAFESFKESGTIEYTADVILAIQLKAQDDIKGGADPSGARLKLDEAKKANPRQIVVKCLKNRQGANFDIYFMYYPANDFFLPCKSFEDDSNGTGDSSSSGDSNSNGRSLGRTDGWVPPDPDEIEDYNYDEDND